MKQQEVQERDFYSIAEAAKRIGCSRGLIWKQCDKGIIPYSKFGNKMFVPAKYIQDKVDEAMSNWEQDQTK